MDDATESAVLKLQLKEIDTILHFHHNDDGYTSTRTALEIYREELIRYQRLLRDRRLARRVEGEVGTAHHMVAAVRHEEVNASHGYVSTQQQSGQHQAASEALAILPPEDNYQTGHDLIRDAVQQVSPEPVLPTTQKPSSTHNHDELSPGNDVNAHTRSFRETLRNSFAVIREDWYGFMDRCEARLHAQLNLLCDSSLEESENNDPTTISKSLSTSRNNQESKIGISATDCRKSTKISTKAIKHHDTPKANCTSCVEPFVTESMLLAPCKHAYCRTCIARWVEMFVDRASEIPSICCSLPISAEGLAPYVSLELLSQFTAKQDEIQDALTIRCAGEGCGTRIPPGEVQGDKGHCAICKHVTCRHCGRKWHEGETCEEGQGRQMVQWLAEWEGWQSCYNCHMIVGMTVGCNHIT